MMKMMIIIYYNKKKEFSQICEMIYSMTSTECVCVCDKVDLFFKIESKLW